MYEQFQVPQIIILLCHILEWLHSLHCLYYPSSLTLVYDVQIDRLTNGWSHAVEIDATVITLHVVVKQEAHLFCLSNRHCSSATQLPFSNTVTEKKQWIQFKKNFSKVCRVISVVAQFHGMLCHISEGFSFSHFWKNKSLIEFFEIKKNDDYKKYITNINKSII